MTMRLTIICCAVLAGCATMGTPPAGADTATAVLAEPGGREVGRAALMQEAEGVRVRIEVSGLAAGRYGAHLHRSGRCEGPSFESAGAHWNPTGAEHGFENPSGRHRGDLPNIVVGADRRGTLAFEIRGARLRGDAGMLDADGAALVVHAAADDYRTDPSGNSGARIACGVVG